MTKPYLKFNGQGQAYLPKIVSRRLRLDGSTRTAAYKSDGDPDDDDDDDDEEEDEGTREERALLKKITKRMAKEFQKRGIADKASIAALVATHLNGLDVEKLKGFDAEAQDLAVRNAAEEINKIKANMQNRGAEGKRVPQLIKLLELRMKDLEDIHRAKGEDKREVKMNIRAAAVMGTTNTIDETTFAIPDDIIESFSISEFVGKRFGRQYIYDVADRRVVPELTEYMTWLEEGDEEGAFAIVAESGLKPLVSTSLVRNFTKYKKVAGKYIITEEFAKFRKNAYSIIRNLIMDKLVRDYNALVTADFLAEASGYIGTTLDGTILDPNDYDAIGAAAAQLESLHFLPDVLVLNPQDKWRLRLSKDAEGRYLFPVVTENGTTVVLGMTLVTSTYVPAGSFVLAERGLFKIEEEPIQVRIGYGITVTGSNPVNQVVSDFDNNQMRVIVEMFFRDWLATPNTGSIISATFASIKAVLAP